MTDGLQTLVTSLENVEVFLLI